MKKLFTVLLLVFSFIAAMAQNYQCLQSGVKHYFTNGNGYLRGIRIDSVKILGDTTVYYPFHTPRGPWEEILGGITTSLDSNGGSWLGKKVLQLNDGTFLFDNLWGDTIIINTQASLGDSWIFYHDTSGLYYTATITSVDTMTFLQAFDTVKTITINAYYDSAIVTTDSLNGFQVILSKNNGFVQAFDLYTFPYHPAGSVYTSGLDYYLDMSLTPPHYYIAYYSPGIVNSIYKIVTFIDPSYTQLAACNVGDVFETAHYYGLPSFFESYILDTIITKAVLSDSVTYTSKGLSGVYNPATSPYATSSYIISDYEGGYTTYDSSYLFDPTKMPEETYVDPGDINPNTMLPNYYFPEDTGFCTTSPAYISGWVYGEDGNVCTYKIGFGQTDFLSVSDNPSYWEDKLLYADKNNNPCGSFYPISLSVPALNSISDSVTIFPNPVTASLNIASSNSINQIIITNLLGQTVYNHTYNSRQVQVDVSGLANGIYFIKINGTKMQKFIKE